jgi:hypothetical protein
VDPVGRRKHTHKLLILFVTRQAVRFALARHCLGQTPVEGCRGGERGEGVLKSSGRGGGGCGGREIVFSLETC